MFQKVTINVMESGYEDVYGIIYDYSTVIEEDFEEDYFFENEEEVIEGPTDNVWLPGLDEVAEA